jgi:hypothetical protein
MKKPVAIALLLLLCFGLVSTASHKFYVAIFQVKHVPEKKMIQITARIFTDDLNNALQKKYKQPFHLGEKEEAPEELALMKQYIADNFKVDVNRQRKPLVFISKEIENNVLVCYFKITDVPKIGDLSVTNTILFDFVTEQQNIIQITVGSEKENMLLTLDKPQETMKFNSNGH